MIDAIVFDFDGVIVDTEPLHYQSFMEVMQPMGISFDYATYMREYIGFDDRDAFRHAAAERDLRLTTEQLAELIDQKARAFAHVVSRGVVAFPGSVELIRAGAEAGPIAIASGALRSDIDMILPALDDGSLPPLFGTIVTADDVARSKPDPATYALAAERLGVDPARCLAIEDTPTGLAAARAAGLRTLAVTNSYPADQLMDEAERVVTHLTEASLENLRTWFA